MSYILPSTLVYVCRNIPWDMSYKHTVLFDSTSDQLSYFVTMAKYTFAEHSYQRAGKGKIRVQELADNLLDCNYLVFQNSAFGDKWFYCFITGCEYVNNITTELTYEIDVIQTWLFDWSFDQCLIERQHTDTDNLGEYVALENVPMGDIKTVEVGRYERLCEPEILWLSGYDKTDRTPGCYLGGLPSGINIYAGGSADNYYTVIAFFDFLQEYYVDNNREESIDAIWIQPKITAATTYTWDETVSYDYDPIGGTAYITSSSTPPVNVFSITPPSTIDGYTPRNNKLFCYPYNTLSLEADGESGTYRWEWFNTNPYADDTTVKFAVTGSTCPNPEVLVAPVEYNGDVSWADTETESTNISINFTEGLTIRNFPLVSWAVDAYRAWVAGGGYFDIGVSLASGVVSVVGGAGQVVEGKDVGGSVTAANGALGSIAAIKSQVYDSQKGATGQGTQSGSVLSAMQAKTVYYKFQQIQAEYAQMIDDYFTRYGYLLNTVGTPNRRAREHYTYIKTGNCTIHSLNMPADDAAKIEQIHDTGITYWRAPSYVGNYSLDNTPASELEDS